MLSDNQKRLAYMTGYVAGNAEDEHSMCNFTWAWSLMTLFIKIAGPEPKIESAADFKKAINDLNERIQAMEIPDLEVTANED